VDQVRHSGGGGELTMEELHELGARRWREVRPALAAAGETTPLSGSVRQSWDRAVRVVIGSDVGEVGPASLQYLAACWLRHDAIDELAARIVGSTVASTSTEQEAGSAVSEVATR